MPWMLKCKCGDVLKNKDNKPWCETCRRIVPPGAMEQIEVSEEDAPAPERSSFFDRSYKPKWEVGQRLQVRRDPSRKGERPVQKVEVVAKVEAQRGQFRGLGTELKEGEEQTIIYTVRDLSTGDEYMTLADTLQPLS